jgi:RNase H-fold protein (predicted Holliday junction resolvase)
MSDLDWLIFQDMGGADWLRKQFPTIELVRIDERNTSQLAAEALYQGGMRKSQRQKKENLDKEDLICY